MRQRLLISASLVSMILSCALAAQAASVGTAGAVNTTSTGAPPGGGPRVIEIGAQVVHDERIVTSSAGSVQIVFIDKTTLNIGPGSELVIDRFVYNPDAATGEIALSLGKGALRLVGGQATHTGGATIKTPVASIGVRGGIAIIQHCAGGGSCGAQGTTATNVFGHMTIDAGGSRQRIDRPDFTSTVAAGGGAASSPARATPTAIAQSIAATTSSSGQTGGAINLPTDRVALAAGTGAVNAAVNPPTSTPRQASTTAAPLRLVGAVTTAGQSSSVAQTVSQGQQNVASNVAVAQVQAALAAKSALPQAYTLTTTAGAGSSMPFLTASFATSGGAIITPVYGYRAGGLNTDGSANNTSRVFQASLVIDGAGAAQTSTFNVATGVIYSSTNAGTFFSGGFRATSRNATQAFPYQARGDITSTSESGTGITVNTIPTDTTGLPTGSFAVSQNANSGVNNNVIATAATAVQTNSTAQRNYTYDQTFSPTSSPSGLGDNHPVAALTGYAGGLARSANYINTNNSVGGVRNSTGPVFIVTNASNSPNDISVNLQSGSRLSADFAIKNINATGASNEFSNANLGFGTLPTNGSTQYAGGRGAYVDLTHFAAIQRGVSADGGVTYNTDSLINGSAISGGGSLLNANALGVGSVPGFTPCDCAYTQWGVWSLDSVRSQTSTTETNDRTGIAFWVAGTPSSFTGMPTTGTATYTGHAIASVATGPASNPTAQYIAPGSFTSNVDFGARTAGFNVSLDGATYAGTAAFAKQAATFSGNLPSSVTGRNLTLNGTLYQAGSASPVGEIGGSLNVQGTNYLASGIFLGKK